MFIRIVGLNTDTVFYQVKECGSSCWRQYTKGIDDFIKMMFILFPSLIKEVEAQHFVSKYQVAQWLYNYGETELDKLKGDAYIFFYHR